MDVRSERDYLWEYAAILFWEHLFGVMLQSEEPQDFAVVRRYSKLA